MNKTPDNFDTVPIPEDFTPEELAAIPALPSPRDFREPGMLRDFVAKHAPKVRRVWAEGRPRQDGEDPKPFYWEFNRDTYEQAHAANRARLEWCINAAIVKTGSLALLAKLKGQFPKDMQRMIESRLRKEQGIPRKTWKWSPEARLKLSAARKGKKDAKPRKRGYPLFTLEPGFPLPESGHRFTVTRATLEEIRAMVFPEGL